MDQIDQVNMIVAALPLPIVLPEDALAITEEQRLLPDITLVLSMLPAELMPYLDLDVTASNKLRNGQVIFRLMLIDEGSLKIRVQNRTIIEIERCWE
jgi:hypothetical protein